MTDKSNEETDIDLPEVDRAVSKSVIQHLVADMKDRRKDFWVGRIFRYSFYTIGLIVFVQMQMGLYGYSVMPDSKTVGVVAVEGVVASNTTASGDAIIPVLKDLFNTKEIEGIVLLLKSGGGSPNEAERINAYIDLMKKKTGKRVIAVCDGMCASAAYMIALHADEVYASRYTIVGSIGAILQGWDLHKTIDLIDADYRVFSSGEYKDLMNSYKKLDDAKTTKLQTLVNGMATIFKDEVLKHRGEKIKTDYDLFTGEIWDGKTALDYGLIDRVGTLETALQEQFPGVNVKRFAVRRAQTTLMNKLFSYVDEKIMMMTGINSTETPIQFKL